MTPITFGNRFVIYPNQSSNTVDDATHNQRSQDHGIPPRITRTAASRTDTYRIDWRLR